MEGTNTAQPKTLPDQAQARPALVAALILLCGLLVGTYLLVSVLNNRLAGLAESRFEAIADHLQIAADGRLDQYEAVLYGASGFFNASDQVDRGEWRAFYQSLDPGHRLTDLMALSFIRPVPGGERAAFISSVRNDTSRDAGGYPLFTIKPEGTRSEYLVNDFVEPLETNPELFGYDAGTDAVQAAALHVAANSGEIQSTGFDDASFDGTVLIVALPIYVGHRIPSDPQERVAGLEGYVAGTFRVNDFLRNVIKTFEGSLGGMVISITDSDSGKTVALVGKPEDVPDGMDLQRSVRFANREMRLALRAERHFGLSEYETNISLIAGIMGIIVSFVVFGSLLFLSRSRSHAMELVTAATKELAVKRDQLARQNESLEANIQTRTLKLNEKVAELEQSKAAMVNILEDLTIAKDEIEAARAYDEALLASIGDGVIAVDPDGRIKTVNRAFELLLDVTASDITGKPIFEVLISVREDGTSVPPEERASYKALHAQEYKTFRTSDHYYRRSDGSIFPAAVDASPIIDSGKVVGVVQVVRDITREKEIDRAKSEFVSLASHQLRTPLTTVGWYTELLISPDTGPLNDTQSEYITEVRGANRRMVDLVDALLNVSRIELGTFVIEPVPTDVVKMVKDGISDITSFVAKKNLHLDEWYESTEMVFPIDQTLMRMVVQNLLSNAVKYTMPNGTITVKVGRKEGRFMLSVSDSGIGIPRKDQPDIFKKMFRTDQARLLDPDGTGLGLYLAKSIVEASGGELSFTSEEKKGSTFTSSWPETGMKARAGERRLQPTPITSQIRV